MFGPSRVKHPFTQKKKSPLIKIRALLFRLDPYVKVAICQETLKLAKDLKTKAGEIKKGTVKLVPAGEQFLSLLLSP